MKNTKNKSIYCLSYFRAKPGCVDELIKALSALLEPTRAEDGCLLYELAIDDTNPNFLIMVEKFIDKQALAFHEQQDYVKHFVEQFMGALCDKVTWHEAALYE